MNFGTDVSLAIRRLRRSPSFTIASIVTISLSLAAITALSSIANTLLLNPQGGIANPESIVRLELTWPFRELPYPSARHFDGLRQRTPRSIQLAYYEPRILPIQIEGQSPTIFAHAVSPNYFEVLGARMTVGAGLADSIATPAQRQVIVSTRLWRDRLGSDPFIIGRTVTLGGDTGYVVTAVAQDDFHGPEGLQQADVWVVRRPSMDWGSGRLIGRLIGTGPVAAKHAVASAELSTLWTQVTLEGNDRDRELWRRSKVSLAPLGGGFHAENHRTIGILLGGVGTICLLTLLIAAANVVSLTLARGVARTRTFAIKRALGARRTDLVRDPMLEVLLLFVAATAVGLAVAKPIGAALVSSLGLPAAFDAPVTSDLHTVLLTLAIGGAAAMVCSLLPSLFVMRVDGGNTLRTTAGEGVTRSGWRLQSAFLSAQLFIAFLLVVSSAVAAMKAGATALRDVGIPMPDGLLVLRMPDVHSDALARSADALVAQLEQRFGYGSVATAFTAPGENRLLRVTLVRAHDRDARIAGRLNVVSTNYLKVIRARLVAGRFPDDADVKGSEPIALLSRSAAARFRSDSMIGSHITIGEDTSKLAIVIGVVEDVLHDREQANEPVMYVFADQYDAALGRRRLLVRSMNAVVMGRVIDSAFAAAFPAAPRQPVRTVAQQRGIDTKGARALLTIVMTTAATGLLIALVGVFGLAAYRVQQQRREIGIRMALGASAPRIIRVFVGGSLRVALVGIGPAFLMVVAMSQSLGMFVGPAADGATRAAVFAGLALLTTALVGSLAAVLQTADLSPARVLRSDS